MRRLTALLLSACLLLTAFCIGEDHAAVYDVYGNAKDRAVRALTGRLYGDSAKLYVYREYSSAENHFTQKALMFGYDREFVHDMDENCTSDPHFGKTCIRCSQFTTPGDWGGWLFLNGYLPKGETEPHLSDGLTPGQGLDLSGAEKLTFWAKGSIGGERVEFFTCGFGIDGDEPNVPYPDSAVKHSTGVIELSSEWEQYEIPLQNCDLSSIALGFGYVMGGADAVTGENTFYLDDVCFEGTFDCPYPLLRSYDTDNLYIKNTAFTYDNALTAMAFLSEGMQEEAQKLLDSFVFAVNNDRYHMGRVRNAYIGGDIRAFLGWESGARLSGWYDSQAASWYEDRYQVGTNVGNASYAALALLAYDTAYGSPEYVQTAASIMDWVLEECADDTCGFLAGYDGWREGENPVYYPFTYKSTEHNIDAYAAFRSLYAKTGEEKYAAAAQSALDFIFSMYDRENHLFLTGTLDDGVTPNAGNTVLDTQVWTALALNEEDFAPYLDALKLADRMNMDGGYPFCLANANGGWWLEGTAFTALTWRKMGEDGKAAQALDALSGMQDESGLFPAATVDDLSTGFELFDGSPWLYSTDLHIAPTAWFVMAVNGFNPYNG